MVPDVLGSSSFLASPELHLDDDLAGSFYGSFLSHPETNLGFGGLSCILLGDNGLLRDFADFSYPREIG